MVTSFLAKTIGLLLSAAAAPHHTCRSNPQSGMYDVLSFIGLDGEHEQAECQGHPLDRGANEGVVGGGCRPVCFAIEPGCARHKVQLRGLIGFADTGATTITDKGQLTETFDQCACQADCRNKSGLSKTEQSNLAKTEKSQAPSL
jgi:hypothetical protein